MGRVEDKICGASLVLVMRLDLNSLPLASKLALASDWERETG